MFVENYLISQTKYFFSYLVFPIYAGINLNDFSVTLGWQTGWMIRSAAQSKSKELADEMRVTTSESLVDLIFFEQIDFGLNLGLGYFLTRKIH